MISLQTLVLAALLSGTGEPVLLDFYADWCGPCRTMNPTVERLAADGYPVEKVNIDHQRSLAQRYGVDRVPTFIVVVDGREVDRRVGAASYDELTRMIAAAKPAAAKPADADRVNAVRGQSPGPVSSPDGRNGDPKTRALNATVRLKIGDPQGFSVGTGTIIDVHRNEALIITCGHIFRDSAGQGEIIVDLFAPGANGPVAGQLIRYDLDRDIAFVSVRPGIAVTAAPVASAGYSIRRGDTAFSIGCDRGAPATIWDTQITSLNKYQGHDNIQAAKQPVIGRSGGGLFTADGHLIGVCNLADPQDQEGIYAALTVLQDGLDKIGQTRIYQRPSPQLAAAAPQAAAPAAPRNSPSASPPASLPKRMPLAALPAASSNPAAGTQLAALLSNASADTEVICIVRSRSNANGNQVFVLDQPSRDLIAVLARESAERPSNGPVELQASRNGSPFAAPPSRALPGGQQAGQTFRGQSQY